MAATVEERLERLEAQMAEERLERLEARMEMLAKRANVSSRGGFGWTIEEVKERLGRPVVRGPREYELLRRITGVFDGPEDLSEIMRDYINGGRE